MEDWRTALPVRGVALDQRTLTVVTGLLETAHGPQVALQVDDSPAVILPDPIDVTLILNLRESIAARMRAAGEL